MSTQLELTYCNPLPLPDYPRGRATYDKPVDDHLGWFSPKKQDFRETADPTVLYIGGRWYLYPSAGMAYVSDNGVTWGHHRIEPYDCGYAPTVVQWRDRFWMTACGAPLRVADDPLGPFRQVGPMLDCTGRPIGDWMDPMLFADDDDQLYAYWGLAGDGIKGARLDPDQPNRCATERAVMFKFDPSHEWERFGEHNENVKISYVEGPWMVKVRGRYYLTYAAPGTQFSTYAMGAYVGDHPLGPFTYQTRNPISVRTSGLVRGPGHGCITHGPNDTLWAFYTCTVCVHHVFERRIGMDPAGIDDDGNLFVQPASSTPQFAPGVRAHPERGNAAALPPVNHQQPVRASSHAPGRTPDYAVDNYMRTWWQPADDDAQPSLCSHISHAFDVSALRLIWSEPNLDYASGITPGPIRFRLDISPDPDGDIWHTAVDASANTVDMLIDYRTFQPLRARRARLTILAGPPGLQVGVTDFCLFGMTA